MTGSRTYTSPGAFRQALEERLKTISRQEGTDFQRLRRQVAFDRFLARLISEPAGDWILKGGYAMELRFVTARSTCDLGFTVRAGDAESVLDHLQRAGAHEIGDVILEPFEILTTRDWLAFAEIPSPSITMIAREQQLAEKIHAYTLPRSSRNSRARDLIDLHLLITSGSLDVSLCAEALRRTFERRNTHPLPEGLAPPPGDWERPFRVLAEECRIDIGYREAFDQLLRF